MDGRGSIVTGFTKEEKAGSVLEIETPSVLQALRVLEIEKKKQEQQSASSHSVGVIVREKLRVDILTYNISIPYLLQGTEESPWGFRGLFEECKAIMAHLGTEMINVVHVPASSKWCSRLDSESPLAKIDPL